MTFVFLHGSFHAAWNWHRVLPLLESAGHRGISLDLPGHGRDATPPRHVTLARCVDRVLAALNGLDEPAVLVAHSRNGIVISEAAERRPEAVHGLVYLAAYLVPNGRSMMEYAIDDTASLVVQNVRAALPFRTMARLMPLLRHGFVRWLTRMLLPRRWQTHRLLPSAYREALYHDCDEAIGRLAEALLEPEPNWPGFEQLQLTAARFGRVRKVYIECLDDRAVTLGLQRRMTRETPCDRVFSLATGHSPFFAQPARLVNVLQQSLEVFATS
jgi:pimeloyl-ACP methyl ester carboxylesterase